LRVLNSWRSLRVFGTAAIAVLSLATFPASTASAQEDGTSADGDEVEEIVVTGSRIRRDEFTSVSPVQIIDMDRSTLAGLIDTSEILQGSTTAGNSTQINNQFGGFVVDGGPGVNTLDLRGIGPGKTLVLMNGRRLTPAGTRGTVSSVDLNTLPASMIKRVEVLKDGASAVYGSDAVAGVVNIIARDDLDGFAGGLQTSLPEDSGGEVTSADLAYGFNGDNFNVLVGVEWFDREPLAEGDRDWSACLTDYEFDPETGENLSMVDPNTGQPKCWNSPANDYVVVQSGAFAGRWIRDPSVDCVGVTDPCAPGWRIGSLAERKFNDPRQAQADVISAVERLSFFSFGNLDLTMPRVAQQSVLAENFSPFYDPAAPFSELPLLLTFDDLSDQEVDWTRVVAGFTGEISDNWDFDIYYSYGRSNASYSGRQFLTDRVTNMLDVVEVSTGVFDCRINTLQISATNGSAPCVFFNPWDQIGPTPGDSLAFPQEVLDYATSIETGSTTYTQYLVDGFVTGELLQLPAGGLGAAFGFQYREEKINDRPSSGSINGNLFGFSSAGITAGTEKVSELYAEVEAPLLRDVTAFQDLTLQVSGRYTDYDTSGDDTVYKAGLNWQIIDQVRLRGSFGTSFRAPALYENFLGGQTGFFNGSDPCEDWNLGEPGTNVYQNCQGEGLPVDWAGFTSTPEVVTFGNAGRLVPETSENLTIGTVLDFDTIGLSFAVDYFDIQVDDEIDRLGSSTILRECYNLSPSDFRQPGTVCDFVGPRNTADNNIDDINDSFFNVNQRNVEGYDITARWVFTLAAVDFAADFRGTKIETLEQILLGDVVEDINNTTGLPDWNAQFDLRADWNNWTFFYNLDWIGEQEDYSYFEIDPSTVPFVLGADEQFYHGVSARYTAETWSAQLGVTNIADEQPPLYSSQIGLFTLKGAVPYTGYDFIGRSVFMNFRMEF
jgi:outer membrane receptor protein involved in Fe transport